MAGSEPDPKRVLIADDEINIRRVLEAILRRDGYEVVTAANGEEALAGMSRDVNTVITDLKMPGLDGMGLLKRLSVDYPDVPVVMITAHGSVESAVEAVKLGAFDYVEKPFDQEQLRQIVGKALRTHMLSRRDARPEDSSTRGRFRLVGESAAIRQVYQVVEKVADTPSTVLITGESGTGKELVARALHEYSSRSGGPFIKINCAAIPKTLMESEMFGYEKGAFTGAVGSKPGRFELAGGLRQRGCFVCQLPRHIQLPGGLLPELSGLFTDGLQEFPGRDEIRRGFFAKLPFLRQGGLQFRHPGRQSGRRRVLGPAGPARSQHHRQTCRHT